MTLNIILFALIAFTCYLVAEILISKNISKKISKYLKYKSDKYYEDLMKYYEKNKKVKLLSKLNILHKINILIEKAGLQRGILLNPITIILLCIVTFIICYLLVVNSCKIIFLSMIISAPSLIFPIFILSAISEIQLQ